MPFCIAEMKNIIIYGGGLATKEYKQYLEKITGKSVKIIIDQEPEIVKERFPACQVMNLNSVSHEVIKNAIVVIALQNGLLHDQIASDLYSAGCRNILFLPTVKKYSLEHEMQKCYQLFIEKKIAGNMLIPLYEEMQEDTFDNVFQDDGDRISAFIEKEYVFSGRIKEKISEKYKIYFDKNICCCLLYIDIFSCLLSTDKKCPKEYLDYMRAEKKEAWLPLLYDRYKLWCAYEEKMNRSPNYFLYAAATAHWNEDGYFNIEDGHHRSTYLMLKGWYEFPLRISKEDYNKYLEYSQKQGWCSADKNVRKEWNRISSALLQWLTKNKLEVNKVLDLSQTSGYFAWQLEKTCKAEAKVLLVSEIDKVRENCYDVMLLPFEDKGKEIINKWLSLHIGKYIVAERSFVQNFPEYRQVFCLYQGFLSDKQKVIGLFEFVANVH